MLYVEDEDGFPLVASDGVNVDGYIITIEDDTRYSLRTPKVRWLRVEYYERDGSRHASGNWQNHSNYTCL